jgi:hypothetical protein
MPEPQRPRRDLLYFITVHHRYLLNETRANYLANGLQVMEEKLGFGKRGPRGWQQNLKGDASSGSHRTFYDGESFGDRALLQDKVLTGSLTALTQDPIVAFLTRTDFHHILRNGFKGDLRRKLEYLKESPLVHEVGRAKALSLWHGSQQDRLT